MTLTEQIAAQAKVLLRDLEEKDYAMLELLSRSAEVSLKAKLRPGIQVRDCIADFVAAASLFVVAAMSELDEVSQMEQITAGDLTMRRKSGNAAGCCLRYQAELMMMPYMRDPFAFVGV
ncbi:MAG: hypothetical protein J6K03_04750 [Oscillospiraceae bacterium]|nr:hypothetical protein [Oscillospiraceae bacterium]